MNDYYRPNFDLDYPNLNTNQSQQQPWTGFQIPSIQQDDFRTKLFDMSRGGNPGNMDMSMNQMNQQGGGNFFAGSRFNPGAPSWKDQTWSQRIFGGQDSYGNKWGGAAMPALQLGQAGLNTFLGFKQLGQAEDALKFQKDAFSRQFENQSKLVRDQQRHRQQARVAMNPNAQSVDSYMKEFGV